MKIKVLVFINLNNLIGVVYSDDLFMEFIIIVCEYKLLLLSDEIYEKILYDGVIYSLIGVLCDDVLIIIFNGLVKIYCVVGLWMGWMVLSGCISMMDDLSCGLDMLVLMCLCVNVLV